MTAQLHLAENALALHLLLQHLEGLVDIVAMDENLHSAFLFDRAIDGADGQGARATGERNKTIRMPMAPAERDGFRFSLNLKIKRFGMAHRLSSLDAFVRPESEQYRSHPRL